MGMLVLSRMKNQSCFITVPASATETEIEVLVTDLRGEFSPVTEDMRKKVRLGFTAPAAVSIDRAEVRRRKEAGKVRAAK